MRRERNAEKNRIKDTRIKTSLELSSDNYRLDRMISTNEEGKTIIRK